MPRPLAARELDGPSVADQRVQTLGKTNPLTVLLFLAVGFGAWWGFLFIPVYVDQMEVKEATRQIVNLIPQAGDPMNAVTPPLFRLNSQVGWHFVVDEETGIESVKPGLGLTAEDNVTVDVDEQRKLVTVRIEYDRVVQLKPLERRRTLHFVAVATDKLQ